MICVFFSLISRNISDTISDEEAVIEYISSQNTVFFDVLYRRYSSKVYGKCVSILKDKELAEDAVQEIFVKVLLNISKFSGKSKFSTWLYSVTYNFCIDFVRRKKRDKSTLVEDMAMHEGNYLDEIDDKFLLEMNIKKLKTILSMISASDKSVLLMKYQDDLSIREIAMMMSKTESAVKMKLKRAKEKCKRIFDQQFVHT